MRNIQVIRLNSFKEKAYGLLAFKKPVPVFFKTRFGIHTLGMKFPIDVLVLDKNFRVVKTVTNLKPNRIFIWNPSYSNILELPSGHISKAKIKLNDNIKITIADNQKNL